MHAAILAGTTAALLALLIDGTDKAAELAVGALYHISESGAASQNLG